MKRRRFGWHWCRGRVLRYTLLTETRSDGQQCYGVRVDYGKEAAEVRDITLRRPAVIDLLAALRRGRVTPVTLNDIIEDRLAELE